MSKRLLFLLCAALACGVLVAACGGTTALVGALSLVPWAVGGPLLAVPAGARAPDPLGAAGVPQPAREP